MILAGDIGGTSTRLALFEVERGKLVSRAQAKYPSRAHQGLDEIIKTFVVSQHAAGLTQRIEHAAFGIAGPIRDERVQTSNLPWIIDARQLRSEFNLPSVYLLNDLEANAYGIAELGPSDFVTLNAGQADPRGNAAIISAGTGLGEAGIYFDGKQLHPFACEGGHCDFSPRNEIETELLLHLQKKFAEPSGNHVSYERVLAGPGLRNIYEFLRDTGRGKESPELADALKDEDPSAAISKAGLDDSSALCVQALDLFVAFYGAEAGNLALKMLATRCMYVGGGIAPKIISKLQEPRFLEAFCDKGRLKSVLQMIPVRVIMNDQTALLGSARYAAVQAQLLAPWSG